MSTTRYISFVDPYYLSLLANDHLPWSKMYQSLLDDYRFIELENDLRFYLMGLMMLALKHKNKIPASAKYLKTQLHCSTAIKLGPLLTLDILELYTPSGKVIPTPFKSSLPTFAKELYIEVLECWKEALDHPKARLDAKRQQKIRLALQAGYSVSDLKEAILGCTYSPFHLGENAQRKKYDSLELILRDASHIDKFIALFQQKQKIIKEQEGILLRQKEHEMKMRLEADRELGLI